MKAVRYRVGAEGAPRIGRLEGDSIIDAGGSDVRGFIPSIENWGALESAGGETFAVADVTLLHPTVPEKIVAIGLNYRDHAEESKLELPDVPVVFAKFPSALVGPGAAIVIPREETRPDWEGEVAVVIGRRTYRADELGPATRSAGSRSCTTSPAAARSSKPLCASSRWARASTPSRRSARAWPRLTGSSSTTSPSPPRSMARRCRARTPNT